MFCQEPSCGNTFVPYRITKDRFCSKACRVKSDNRDMKRGRKIIGVLIAYSASHKNRDMLNTITREARIWRDEDRSMREKAHGDKNVAKKAEAAFVRSMRRIEELKF